MTQVCRANPNQNQDLADKYNLPKENNYMVPVSPFHKRSDNYATDYSGESTSGYSQVMDDSTGTATCCSDTSSWYVFSSGVPAWAYEFSNDSIGDRYMNSRLALLERIRRIGQNNPPLCRKDFRLMRIAIIVYKRFKRRLAKFYLTRRQKRRR